MRRLRSYVKSLVGAIAILEGMLLDLLNKIFQNGVYCAQFVVPRTICNTETVAVSYLSRIEDILIRSTPMTRLG